MKYLKSFIACILISLSFLSSSVFSQTTVAQAQAWLSPAQATQFNINYERFMLCIKNGYGNGRPPSAEGYCMGWAGPANGQLYEQQRGKQMDECLSTSYMQRFSKIHGAQNARQTCKMDIQSGMPMLP
jgi:hypothetical protein